MSGVKIGLLISGSGSNLQAILDKIDQGEIRGQVVMVLSNKEEAYGLERARRKNIPALYVNRKDFPDEASYNSYIIDLFKEKGVELVVLAGYLRVLSQEFIQEFPNRIINIHPSLIPSFCGRGYYGRKVHEAVINYGVKLTGATVHFVDEGTDTGPIILQDVVRVREDDSPDSLQARVLELEHRLLVEAVSLFCEGRLRVEARQVSIL